MDVFEYYRPPEEITVAIDKQAFADQAKEPEKAHPVGIALSDEWEVVVNRVKVPVLSTPVTFRGPHHFCQLRFIEKVQTLSFVIRCTAGNTIQVRSLTGEVPITKRDDGVAFSYSGVGQLTLEVNGKPDSPLSIHISAPELDKPDRNDPNVIWFGPGVHRIHRLELQDNQTVYLENGALIQAIPPLHSERPIIEDDWAHVPEYNDFICADGKNNISIRGMGLIDTTQLPWHARRTVVFQNCTNARVEGITTIGAAHWTILLWNCINAIVKDIKVFGYRTNTDAVDLVNCKDTGVVGCYLRTGDDAVCLKGMLPPEVLGGENVIVKDCIIWTEKARSLGVIGETRGDFKDIIFENCLVLHGYANWTRELGSLCVVLSDGGTVENVTFRDITISQEDSWVVDCMIRPDFWSTDNKPGHIRSIRFENICVPQNARMNFQGFDAAHVVEDISLYHVFSIGEEQIIRIHRNDYVRNIYLN